MQLQGCIIFLVSMDAIFRALADRTRRRLLDRLHARNGQALGELIAGLRITRQAASKHLAALENANLISTEWKGREKLHYLNPVPIHQIADRWIGKFERSRLDALATLKESLQADAPLKRERKKR